MTAIAAKTGRPPSAAIAWATKDGIFVEFPTKAGPPYITRLPKTAQGLQTALNILIENPAPAPSRLNAPHPAVRKINGASAATKNAAAEIVRRMLLK